MKRLARIGIGLATLALGFVGATALRQNRHFDAPTPDIHSSSDPAVIARGRYLVQGPAHCADCHGDDYAGRKEFNLPVGTFRTANITSDRETGIGDRRDEDIARILRHGVRPDGTAVLPFMPFQNLTDEDLGAVISFLRTVPPVHHEVAPHDVNTTGKLIKAWVLEPRGPSEPNAKSIARGPTPEYGRYLAHSVANCVGCHTKIDMRTGEFAGPLFGGGAVHASSTNPEKKFVTPNLTPDERWGWIAGWQEEVFVARMKVGRIHDGSPMPWQSFQKMSDDDARALYRYLRTVPKAAGGPDPEKAENVLVTASN